MADKVERGTRQANSGLEGTRYHFSEVSERARQAAERVIGPYETGLDDEEDTAVIERSTLEKQHRVQELAKFLTEYPLAR